MKGVIRNRFRTRAKAGAWAAHAVLVLGIVLGQAGCVGCPTCGKDDGAGGSTHAGPGSNGVAVRGSQWDLIDRCYPERYTHMAVKEVNSGLAPQVQNGHVLDQTVWTYYFEPGTDRLTPAGLEHLAYIVRRRPCPDTTVYLQTANDLVYDPACPDRFAGARLELDGLRVQAVQKFLVAASAGRPVDFQVLIHDPGDTTIPGIVATQEFVTYTTGVRGRLTTGGGGGGGGAAAAIGGR
jgi:hypothetical protein